MKTMLKAAAFGAAFAATPALFATGALAQAARPATPTPAAAPAASGPVSVGVVDLEAAVNGAAAFQTAMQQIQTTYATQITAYRTRATAIQTELAPLQTELQTLQGNAATPRATLEQKANTYRTRAAAAQEELNRLGTPFLRPRAYAEEQVTAQLDAALRGAMTAQRINVVIKPEAILAITPGAPDLTPAVTAQLNTLIRTVSITPPAGWEPGQQRAAAQPAGTPQGR